MKKTILSLLFFLLGGTAVFASSAYPRPRQVMQPDGTMLTIVGHGDEFSHYVTTTDGYTVVKHADGYYHYAKLQDGKLVATNVRANDLSERIASEVQFLKTVNKHIAPSLSAASLKMKSRRLLIAKSAHSVQGFMKARRQATAGLGGYRGLVVLVNFNDRKFVHGTDESRNFYNQLLNGDHFTEYDDKLNGKQEFTGSVRDYFRDNSYGKFVPDFDVVGPVDVDCSQYYINGVDNTYALVEQVLDKIDKDVDFSRYDSDSDGDIDMVYFIYAGYSSSYQGNDERLVWPHAGSMVDPSGEDPDIMLDGKRMARFACSSEIYGWDDAENVMLDGMGVIVHEFSHVLGFEDHYDTSGGQQEHPNTWDVMAAGSYNGEYNRTPAGYNSYEKAVAGFISPLDISNLDNHEITLHPFAVSQDACLLKSVQPHVSFYMENRQPLKWDACLPGHGMLVWRVDSVMPELWQQNVVNVTSRPCFRLVRASGTQGDYFSGVEDKDFDPFPGTRNVTSLTNDPAAATLWSYDRYGSPAIITDIVEEPVTLDDGKSSQDIKFLVSQDPETDDRTISYVLADKFVAQADRVVTDDNGLESSEHISWVVTSNEVLEGNKYTVYVYNLMPKSADMPETDEKGVALTGQYLGTGRSFIINSQRLARNDEYSTWVCNFTDMEQQGAGIISLSINRHGIPALDNPDAEIGYCAMQPNAYIASQKRFIKRLVTYRNLTFSEYEPSAGIEDISVYGTARSSKGVYNICGQRVTKPTKGIYICNGKKMLVGK